MYSANMNVLAIQSHPANWHSLFHLEVKHCLCFDAIVSLVQYYANQTNIDKQVFSQSMV